MVFVMLNFCVFGSFFFFFLYVWGSVSSTSLAKCIHVIFCIILCFVVIIFLFITYIFSPSSCAVICRPCCCCSEYFCMCFVLSCRFFSFIIMSLSKIGHLVVVRLSLRFYYFSLRLQKYISMLLSCSTSTTSTKKTIT